VLIEDKVKLKKRIHRRKGKEYVTYYASFSIKFNDVLKKFKELHEVEIITDKGNKIVLPKVNLTQVSYYLRRKTGQKIPQYSFTIPKPIGEELEKQGVKNLRVIIEVPDLHVVKS
jgi:hypothetical protein